MDSCIFCKIARGEIPVPKIYEDEYVIAFTDLRPLNPGHTLLIPKVHSETFLDMTLADYEALMRAALELGKKIHVAYPSPRLSLFTKGFEIAHTHLHLIPLNANEDIVSGKYGLDLPEASLHEREEMAKRIREV